MDEHYGWLLEVDVRTDVSPSGLPLVVPRAALLPRVLSVGFGSLGFPPQRPAMTFDRYYVVGVTTVDAVMGLQTLLRLKLERDAFGRWFLMTYPAMRIVLAKPLPRAPRVRSGLPFLKSYGR